MPDHLRVAVLRDYSYEERPGEEELAIRRFLYAAPEHVTLNVIPPEFIQAADDMLAQADIVLTFGLKRYPDHTFEALLAHPRHIHVAQDWWEPIQPQSKWRNQIVAQAKRVIFSSPLHHARYLRLYGLKTQESRVVAFPMMETDFGGEPNAILEHEDAVLWCAPWHPDYGSDILLRWAARDHTRVHAFGLGVPQGEITPDVQGCGAVALDAAAPTFRQYQKFVYFPRTPVPFGFAFLLAHQLGLEVTWSNEIGCLSFMEGAPRSIDAVIPLCLDASSYFWNVVEEAA